MMKRVIGLDYGTKTVGVAVSDPLGITAQAVETIERKEENKLRKTLARIEELAKQYDADTIVIGLPLHMNSDEGDRAAASREFAQMVERRTGCTTVLEDERMTTVMAERTLMESKVRRENRKKVIDKIAAVFILQNYLDRMHMQNRTEQSELENAQ